jgi:hypothetical protein
MVIDKPPKDAFSKTGWPGALPVRAECRDSRRNLRRLHKTLRRGRLCSRRSSRKKARRVRFELQAALAAVIPAPGSSRFIIRIDIEKAESRAPRAAPLPGPLLSLTGRFCTHVALLAAYSLIPSGYSFWQAESHDRQATQRRLFKNRLARCARGARRGQEYPPEAAPSAQDIMERRAMQPSVLKEKGSTDRL